MAKFFYAVFSIIILFFMFFTEAKTIAAPPPAEIKKAKAEAPLHLIGTVTADKLYKDLTKENGNPYQIRKMNLNVKRMIKAPKEENVSSIEVFYTYIPSWKDELYVGGKRMDIAVGDVIEIWLEKGEFGWKSSLEGYTMKHLKYAENRIEPIPEPFWHLVKRNVRNVWLRHSSVTVLIGILAFLFTFVLLAWKKQKSNVL